MPRGRRPGFARLSPGAGHHPASVSPHQKTPSPQRNRWTTTLKNYHQSAERGVGVAGNAASTSGNHGKTTSFWVILVPLNTCTLSALGLCTAAPLPMTLSPSFIL